MKNTTCCWSRWELREVIPSTPTLLPSSHPPVHPNLLLHLAPNNLHAVSAPVPATPNRAVECASSRSCVRTLSHTQSLHSQTYSCICIFWSVEIDFLKARPEAVSWSALSTYQGLNLFLNLAVRSLQMRKFLSNIPLDRPYEHNATARGYSPHVSLPNMARVWIDAWLLGQKGEGCSFAH